MRSAKLFLVLWALAAPALLPAQASAEVWTLENGAERARLAEVGDHGYAALPLSGLVTLGARIAYRGDAATASLGELELRFRAGERTYQAGDSSLVLPAAPYEARGLFFLPTAFFRDELPRLAPGWIRVDAESRVVRTVPGAAVLGALARDVSAPAPLPPAVAAPADTSNPRPLIVVDAGHGGVDPGASGPGGTREKDVALAVARRLAEILRADPSLDVRMTRDRDTLIALRDRTRLANAWREGERPALFISVHCNANRSSAAHGFETYFLSEAKTEDARRVEAMENSARQYEEDDGEMTPLDFIFHDLRQNHYLRESSDWAEIIQARLDEVQESPNRGVKQAGFYVLNGAYMPAVLVEIGFITNPAEERLLRSSARQGEIAGRLADAVRDMLAHMDGIRAGG